jgi:3-oxoacyl-(acyl-carrier-protein) synthase
MQRVVVTGIGLVTPLGIGREKTWQAVVRGESAVLPDTVMPGTLSARVKGLDIPSPVRLLGMSFLAAAEAVQDSGIDVRSLNAASRVGCTVSVSKPHLAARNALLTALMPSAVGQQVRAIFNLRGPSQNIVAACATGANAVIIGSEWIRHGLCDVVLAGAAESSLDRLYQAGFRQMGVLATTAVRPFDCTREGFAMGEGAGILVLEREDHARSRGACIYGTINGWAMANDAKGTVAFDTTAAASAQAIAAACRRAGVDTVDYINAHGTATRLNDVIETRAIRRAFGRHAEAISLSSTKAATGHLLGASGAVEIAFTLLALRDQMVPATLNLQEPDRYCDLDYTPRIARSRAITAAASLSFGFGGQIGVTVVGAV